jgi:hypothetical protein
MGHGESHPPVAPFFSDIRGIGTGNPVFGPLPADAEACPHPVNGFATDGPVREALGICHRGRQRQGPLAGGVAKNARTLVQEGS